MEFSPPGWDEFFVGGRCAVEGRKEHPNRIEDPLESSFDAIGVTFVRKGLQANFGGGNGFGYSRREDQ